jgi:paraquat-inducible protein A
MSTFIACHECDLLEALPLLGKKTCARCRRCGAVVYVRRPHSIERTLALAIAGLLLLAVANAYPFLGFRLEGISVKTTLVGGIELLYQNDELAIAALVTITAILAPALRLGGAVYVLLPLYLNRTPGHLRDVFRWLQRIQPWAMIEVFMLGILVSIVKLAQMATIIPGVALWAFAALILVLAAGSAVMDPEEIWTRLEAGE